MAKLPIRIEPMLGEASEHAQMLLTIANATGRRVYEDFNGTDIVANPGDDSKKIYQDWFNRRSKKQWKLEVFQ